MLNLSVVIPIKDEKDNLRPLHERLCAAIEPLNRTFEMVFVDDGSIDGSTALLEQLAREDARVKVVSLRRNFGQTAALQAGIDWSEGEIVVTMDGDLQNDPDDIGRLIAKLEEGYDAVLGRRARRQDGLLLRKIPSNIANWIIRKVTQTPIYDMGCTIRALRRDLADALPLYGELHRFVPVLAKQAGAKLAQIDVKHHPRTAGKTKYNISRTVRVVLDLITVTFLYSYVTRPMHAMGLWGLLSMGAGFVTFLATIWMRIFNDFDMTGNPMLLLSVGLGLMGVQLISMGLLGELMTRTYFESQGKPPYLVRTTHNIEGVANRRAA